MRSQIVEMLQKDRDLLVTLRQAEQKAVIHFDVGMSTRDCGITTKIPAKMTSRMFDTIADLFWDPEIENIGLELDVALSYVSGHSEPAASNIGREPRPEEFVIPLAKEAVERRFFSMGQQSINKPLGYWTPLWKFGVGCYVSEEGQPLRPRDLRLREVDAWGFGNYFIGDPSTAQDNPIEMSAERLEELHRVALQELERARMGTGLPIPFMPTCTFNRYDPARCNIACAKPAKLNVTFKFVSHIEVNYKDEQGHPQDNPGANRMEDWLPHQDWLPQEHQIEFDEFETQEEIITELADEFEQQAKRTDIDGAKRDAARQLFVESHSNLVINGWKLLLFILPQGGRKMHRFPPNGPGVGNRLWHLSRRQISGRARRASKGRICTWKRTS